MERKETIGAAPEVLEAFPQEAEHLRELEEKIALELHAAQESVDKMDQEYREAQQYIADSRGEGDPKEMFQTQMLMGQIDDRGASAVVYRDRLKKTRSSPYFARIDFEPDDGSEPGTQSTVWRGPVVYPAGRVVKARLYYLGKESVTTVLFPTDTKSDK